MIHGPVIWTKIDDNLDFAQVLQRLYTFPVTVRIFLALKMKWEAYLKPVICIRVVSRSRILQSSLYFEEKKEAGTVQESSQDWDSWLNKSYQISLEVCLKYLSRVELLTTAKHSLVLTSANSTYWLFTRKTSTISVIHSLLKVMMTLFWCFSCVTSQKAALCNSWLRLASFLTPRLLSWLWLGNNTQTITWWGCHYQETKQRPKWLLIHCFLDLDHPKRECLSECHIISCHLIILDLNTPSWYSDTE